MAHAVDLRKGMAILYQGALNIVLDHHHIKPGKGPAYMQVSLRNIKTGSSQQVRFRTSESVETAVLESKNMQYIYRDSHGFNFMDMDDFDTVPIDADTVGDASRYIKEGDEIEIQFYNSSAISIKIPTSVVLKVTTTIPGHKGDSVTNLQKPATLETGYELNVPLFIKEGENIRVDTRTGEYLGRK